MIKKIRHNNLFVLIPFLVWCMVLLNGMTNRHHHIDGQGQIISHAHPIQQGEEDHDHSKEELVFLDLISNPQFQIGFSEIHIPLVKSSTPYFTQAIFSQPFFKGSFVGTEFLRGPPVLS